MNIKKGTITTDRFLVPYRLYGQGAQLIVCVNAVQQTMAAWRSVIGYFAGSYRLLLFDFPGQGRGQILSGPAEVSLDEQVQVLHRVVLEQNFRGKCHVVGASWGSIIVAVFAARFPALVDKIILASFGVKTNERLLGIIGAAQGLHDGGEIDKVAALIINTFGRHLSETFKKKLSDQFGSISKNQFLTLYEHGRALQRTQRLEDVVDLSSIKADTMIINGVKDEILNVDDIYTAAAQIPRCRIEIVAGVGHFLHNENDNVLPIYRRFLATRSRSPAMRRDRKCKARTGVAAVGGNNRRAKSDRANRASNLAATTVADPGATTASYYKGK
jgi:pimeloyl-ACP methyl ester carboxylesterase